MRTLSRIALLASLLASAPAHGGGVEILATFLPGRPARGRRTAPTIRVPVGPHHVVDFTNANVVIHDKRTGEVVRQMTQTQFWKAAHRNSTYRA